MLHAAPFVALAAGWLSFYSSCTCKQLKFDGYGWGPHVFDHYAVDLSYMAYPTHYVPLTPDVLGWTLAAIVCAAAIVLFVRGPHIARLAVIGIALALMPFAPVEIWTASRYMYAAVAFFAWRGWLLYYGDAEAHLNIARRIVDSRTPGYDQVGTNGGIRRVRMRPNLHTWETFGVGLDGFEPSTSRL